MIMAVAPALVLVRPVVSRVFRSDALAALSRRQPRYYQHHRNVG